MDEKEFRLEVRLIALELVAVRALAFQLNHLTDIEFEALTEVWVSGLQNETFAGASAVQGDLWSSEIADAMRSLLGMVSDVRDDLRGRAARSSGVPLG